MKAWSKIKNPLLVVLVFVLCVGLRFLLPAIPPGSSVLVIPRFFLLVFSRDLFGNDWLLWDIILFAIAFCCLIAIPKKETVYKACVNFLRITVLLLVFLFTTPLVSYVADFSHIAYRDWQRQQDAARQEQIYQQIREFLDVADVALTYNTATQYHDPGFLKAFPELALEHKYSDGNETKIGYHHSDYLLIDYETQRIGILYNGGLHQFYVYQLVPASQYPSSIAPTRIVLDAPGKELALYCKNSELRQYTQSMALTMADGKIYSISGLSDIKNLFLGIQDTRFQLVRNDPSK